MLEGVSEAGISLDFLKLTPEGVSFLVPTAAEGAVRQTLQELGARAEVKTDRSVVLVHAVNMRDEEGLISRIVAAAIGSGAEIDHLGDMHDRVLIVTTATDAERLRATFESGSTTQPPAETSR